MNIARIDRATGSIVNIEVASREWLDDHADDPDFRFEPYTPTAPAVIGGTHDEMTGFAKPETLTVTRDQLEALVADEVAKADAPVK